MWYMFCEPSSRLSGFRHVLSVTCWSPKIGCTKLKISFQGKDELYRTPGDKLRRDRLPEALICGGVFNIFMEGFALKSSDSGALKMNQSETGVDPSTSSADIKPDNDVKTRSQDDGSESSTSTSAPMSPTAPSEAPSQQHGQHWQTPDTRCVSWGRATMLVCMLFAATLVCTGAYIVLLDEDADDFLAAVSSGTLEWEKCSIL
jgi:hypothetical protein